MTRAVRTLMSFFVLISIVTSIAVAHPLGNFTINHLARITANGSVLRVHYVLDIAEIPAFQIMHGASGSWNRYRAPWTNAELDVVQAGLHVSIDGSPAKLEARSAVSSLRPGAGGLPIIRWVGEFTTALRGAHGHRVAVHDEVYADRRIGWKDVIIGSQTEPTDDLRRYPSALIGTPRRVNAAAFAVLPSGAIAHVREQADTSPAAGTLAAWISPAALSDLFSRPEQTPLFVLFTVLAAFGLGALHAVEPGHGKALLAFTLVGARATTRQALVLALSLTVAHTAGVLLLGIVLFAATGFVSESIYPWITLVSGAAIAVIGARSLAAYVRLRRGITHSHEHGRAGRHSHTHSPTDSARPLNFRTAIVAALSGGIAPCPAAIVVLLAALRLHHLGYGLALIVVFSMGLASVLSGLGIGVVHGAAWLSKRSAYARVANYGPLVTALVISVIGASTLASGFRQNGVTAPAVVIALIALAGITGYAFGQQGHDHPHTHQGAQA